MRGQSGRIFAVIQLARGHAHLLIHRNLELTDAIRSPSKLCYANQIRLSIMEYEDSTNAI